MRIFSLTLAVASIAALAQNAAAADIGARPARVQPVAAPVAAYNWTGFYVGANAGYGWINGDASACLSGDCVSASERLNGFVGGGQLGFNWQTGNIVWGAEVDAQWSGAERTHRAAILGTDFALTNSVKHFGTARGRLGIAMGTWLPYVTAGYGWGTAESKVTVSGSGSVSESATHGVWSVGGGVEAAIAGNWTGKVEYLYLNTGDMRDSVATSEGTLAANASVDAHIVRVGLNYRFQ